MNVHEYQGKEILRGYGVATPRGIPCFSVSEADEAARKLGGKVWVVKAQIHAGGRGKGGGVKVAKSVEEVHEHAQKILGMTLVTHQTGPAGRVVKRLLVEEGADIRQELYVGMVVDRATQRVTLIASSEGGMEIEEVAARSPHRIHKVPIDPLEGLTVEQADQVARQIGVPKGSVPQARAFMQGLYRAFVDCDAALAEINPLVITGDGKVLALDAKLNFDSNALFRHPEIQALRDLDEEDPAEIEASRFDLSYISLDGNIGCLVNGAGLAMATMDVIKLYGAQPANFLDVGGGATPQKVTAAFKLMQRNPAVKGAKPVRSILVCAATTPTAGRASSPASIPTRQGRALRGFQSTERSGRPRRRRVQQSPSSTFRLRWRLLQSMRRLMPSWILSSALQKVYRFGTWSRPGGACRENAPC